MRKPIALTVAVAALGAVAAVPVANAGSTPPPLKVKIDDNFFSPSKKTVKVRTKVTWTWVGDVEHNLVLISAPSGIDKKKYSLRKERIEGTFSRTLPKAGKWFYVCTLHPGMEQRITVKN